MAYFSNGTEGMVLDMLCFACVHGCDETGENRQGTPCAVWLLQAEWNYEQHETDRDAGPDYAEQNGILQGFGLRSREGRVKKEALDLLLPQNGETLCSMYLPLVPQEEGHA
jgi:hypothetical protein